MNNITVCARPDPTLVIKINNKYVNLYTILDLLNYDHNDFERLIYDSDVTIQDQNMASVDMRTSRTTSVCLKVRSTTES